MDYQKQYVDFFKKFVKIKKPLKVVFDCSNGTTGIILKELFRKRQATSDKRQVNYVLLNAKPDGNFPAHGPNPLVKGAMRQVGREVREPRRWVGAPTAKRVGADLGIIFDGDGDRVFFIDNKGRWIDPNESAYVLTRMFKPPYVVGIVSSWRLKKLKVENRKRQVFISQVGHYFFKKLMREKKATLGLEHSGHYYFKDFFYCDSGIFAAIQVINFVSALKMPFSEWLDTLPKYYRSGEINMKLVTSEKRQVKRILEKIEKRYKNQGCKISKLDGLTVEFGPSPLKEREAKRFGRNYSFKGEGWFNVRPSNTEPLLRLNVEATGKKLFNEKLKEIKKIING